MHPDSFTVVWVLLSKLSHGGGGVTVTKGCRYTLSPRVCVHCRGLTLVDPLLRTSAKVFGSGNARYSTPYTRANCPRFSFFLFLCSRHAFVASFSGSAEFSEPNASSVSVFKKSSGNDRRESELLIVCHAARSPFFLFFFLKISFYFLRTTLFAASFVRDLRQQWPTR